MYISMSVVIKTHTKAYQMNHHIETCAITGKSIREICHIYGGTGKYKKQAFKQYLQEEHGLSIEDYLTKYCNEIRPTCFCGCGKQVKIVSKGSMVEWKKYACGRNPGLLEWSKSAKDNRKGANNPMYGKPSWNKNLTKETSDIMAGVAAKKSGQKFSVQHKQRLSESAKKRTKHGHTGHKHTIENKEKIRQNTLQMIKDGKYKQTQTKPHIAVKNILQELCLEFEEEKIISCWSFDFYINGVVIEVQGDYFHSNPKIYPSGPITKTQRLNWYRDIKKREFCQQNNIDVLELWECDILTNPENVKEIILCKLQK